LLTDAHKYVGSGKMVDVLHEDGHRTFNLNSSLHRCFLWQGTKK